MKILDVLCENLLVTKEEALTFINTAPRRYKKYYIPKRNSSEFRLIAQPSKEVKFLQRFVTQQLRSLLIVHPAAMAYEKGVGIKLNASQHQHSRYLLKMDFKNFFPSITPELFFLICKDKNIEFHTEDSDLLKNLLFWKLRRNSPLRLSIGAPSSPFISNFIMSNFDAALSEICATMRVTYTRYADDLTFTTNEKSVLFNIPNIVRENLVKFCHKKIKINTSKTVFSSKASNRHITGITVTNDGKLSTGRERKRLVSSMIHRFSNQLLVHDEILKLKGMLAFIMHIEPNFVFRMKKKYSAETIDNLFNYQ